VDDIIVSVGARGLMGREGDLGKVFFFRYTTKKELPPMNDVGDEGSNFFFRIAVTSLHYHVYIFLYVPGGQDQEGVGSMETLGL